jgi:hypothetical protein
MLYSSSNHSTELLCMFMSMCPRVSQVRACERANRSHQKERKKKDNKLLASPDALSQTPRHRADRKKKDRKDGKYKQKVKDLVPTCLAETWVEAVR